MLMKTEGLQVEECEELKNCYRLLDYIDGAFQVRLQHNEVNFDLYDGEDCGTPQCLLGWFETDVIGSGQALNLGLGDNKYWGLADMDEWRLLFGCGSCGDLNDRRRALLAHIQRLEQREAA